MLLEVDDTELQGNVVEVIGRTEARRGADHQRGTGRRHSVRTASSAISPQPMTRGSHEIVITGQNRRGGTAIKRVQVVIP